MGLPFIFLCKALATEAVCNGHTGPVTASSASKLPFICRWQSCCSAQTTSKLWPAMLTSFCSRHTRQTLPTLSTFR